jgi:predicted transcriptional regulator
MARLGELERSVMNVLWDSTTSLTVREVQAQLDKSDLAYTTIMTVLDRLGAKEMVRRERDGRAFRYSPVLSRDAATSELLHAALDQAGTDRTAALVHFAKTVDPAEAQALRAALDEIEKRTSG